MIIDGGPRKKTYVIETMNGIPERNNINSTDKSKKNPLTLDILCQRNRFSWNCYIHCIYPYRRGILDRPSYPNWNFLDDLVNLISVMDIDSDS